MKKLVLPIFASSLLLLAGCQGNFTIEPLDNEKIEEQDTVNNNKNNNEKVDKDNQIDSKSLLNQKNYYLFHLNNDKDYIFNGIVEYGHMIKQKESNFDLQKGIGKISYEVMEEDLSGGLQNFKPYYLDYTFENGEIKQTLRWEEGERDLIAFGIVPNRTILKDNHDIGFKWEEEVTIEGKKYIIKSEIIDSTSDTVTVYSYIDGLDIYLDGKYEETYTITQGIGISKFERSLEMFENEDGQLEDYGFDFHYEYLDLSKLPY